MAPSRFRLVFDGARRAPRVRVTVRECHVLLAGGGGAAMIGDGGWTATI